ncbi:hypothetical protein BJ742DRAFT_744541 [Cladochytrium replicatum]|nr:hypothetical protein BJ742DRAFT_744541 [Cladochytrium replicatum]
MSEPLSVKGVRLQFFDEFITRCGGRDALTDKTTTEVCNEFLKKMTEHSQTTMVETLKLNDKDRSFVGNADHFISHAWKYKFLDVVDSLYAHFESNPVGNVVLAATLAQTRQILAKIMERSLAKAVETPKRNVDGFFQKMLAPFKPTKLKAGKEAESLSQNASSSTATAEYPTSKAEGTGDIVIWFDLLTNSQWDTSSKPFAWWSTTFMDANDPIPPTRALCVFELYACPASKQKFLEEVDGQKFAAMLGKVDSRKSEAFIAADEQRIHRVIEQVIGFEKMDALMLKTLKTCMIETCRIQYECHKDLLADPDILCMLSLYEHEFPSGIQQLIMVRPTRGKSVDVLAHVRWAQTLAELLHQSGDLNKARNFAKYCLERKSQLLGPGHNDSLIIANNLALTEYYLRNHEASEKTSMNILRNAPPDSHHVFGAKNNLGLVFTLNQKYKEALELYREIFELSSKLFDINHPAVLQLLHNNACAHFFLEEYETAELKLKECLEKKAVLGDNHPDYILSELYLSKVFREQGKLQKAKDLLHKAKIKQERINGNDLQFVGILLNEALLHKDNSDSMKAAAAYNRLLNLKHNFGTEHQLTLMFRLAESTEKAQNYSKALLQFQEMYELSKQKLGKQSDLTLTALQGIARCCRAQNKNDEAAKFYEKYLKHSSSLAVHKDNQLSIMHDLGAIYRSLKQYNSTIEILSKCASLTSERYRPHSEEMLTTLANLGQVYFDNHDVKKGTETMQNCLDTSEKYLGKNHKLTMIALQFYGLELLGIGKKKEGFQLLTMCLARVETLGLQRLRSYIFAKLSKPKQDAVPFQF